MTKRGGKQEDRKHPINYPRKGKKTEVAGTEREKEIITGRSSKCPLRKGVGIFSEVRKGWRQGKRKNEVKGGKG